MTKDDKGKTTVQKLGVGAKQRDGFEYEFSCTFLLDQKTNTAEVQKDNTHLFDHEGAKLLTEGDGVKIMQWANSGEGYTPMVRKTDEEADAEPSSDIATVKKQIVAKATELGGAKNEKVNEVAKKYGNPNKIDDIEVAKKFLEELNNIE